MKSLWKSGSLRMSGGLSGMWIRVRKRLCLYHTISNSLWKVGTPHSICLGEKSSISVHFRSPYDETRSKYPGKCLQCASSPDINLRSVFSWTASIFVWNLGMLKWPCWRTSAIECDVLMVTFVVQEEIYVVCSICVIVQEGTGICVALYQRVDLKRPFITRARPLRSSALWRQA